MSEIFGSEESSISIPPALRSPLYQFAKGLGNQLPDLYTRPLPTYQGNWQPTMGPSAQQAGSFIQGRSVSPAPQVMGQAQGALGGYMTPGMMQNQNTTGIERFTKPGRGVMGNQALQSSREALMRFQNPQFQNPVNRIKRGYPNYWKHGG